MHQTEKPKSATATEMRRHNKIGCQKDMQMIAKHIDGSQKEVTMKNRSANKDEKQHRATSFALDRRQTIPRHFKQAAKKNKKLHFNEKDTTNQIYRKRIESV